MIFCSNSRFFDRFFFWLFWQSVLIWSRNWQKSNESVLFFFDHFSRIVHFYFWTIPHWTWLSNNLCAIIQNKCKRNMHTIGKKVSLVDRKDDLFYFCILFCFFLKLNCPQKFWNPLIFYFKVLIDCFWPCFLPNNSLFYHFFPIRKSHNPIMKKWLLRTHQILLRQPWLPFFWPFFLYCSIGHPIAIPLLYTQKNLKTLVGTFDSFFLHLTFIGFLRVSRSCFYF